MSTTVGRVLLKEIVPDVILFHHINKIMKKKELGDLISICHRLAGDKKQYSWLID